ncbi:MAG: hypothetical protein WAV00_08720 [Nocardioides sp.]
MRQGSGVAHSGGGRASFDTAEVTTSLAELDPEDFDEPEALEAITSLERMKRAACAAPARLPSGSTSSLDDASVRQGGPSTSSVRVWGRRSPWPGGRALTAGAVASVSRRPFTPSCRRRCVDWVEVT